MPSDNSHTHPTGVIPGKKGEQPDKALLISATARILVATLILGSSLFIPEHGKSVLLIPSNLHLYVLTSIIYFYSLISLALVKHIKRPERFIFVQISSDIIFITAFINISGGVESIFIFLSNF